MPQNLPVVVAPGTHGGGADLAQSHAVAPACAVESERLGDAVPVDTGWLGYEGRAVEMAFGKGAAYLELLADDHGAEGADDAQTHYAARSTTFDRLESLDIAEVDAGALADYAADSFAVVDYFPTEEVGCLAVVIIEHLSQDVLVGDIAESFGLAEDPLAGVLLDAEVGEDVGGGAVGVCFEIIEVTGLPAAFELFEHSAAALGEAGVGQITVGVGEHYAACCSHGFGDRGCCLARNTLIALAMVIGAYVEAVVVVAVVPYHTFVGGIDHAFGASHALLANLGEEPAARYHGMRHEQCGGGLCAHFRRYDALEVPFDRYDVDGSNVVAAQKFEITAEGLALLTLPVEIDSYGNVFEQEETAGRCGAEHELGSRAAVPEHGTVGIYGCALLTFGDGVAHGVTAVEVEAYFGARHYADADSGFGVEFIRHRMLWR